MILGAGTPHYGHCFKEIDDAVRTLEPPPPKGRTVVMNAHNFAAPPGTVVFNMENYETLRAPSRWARHEVWDFSARNVARYPASMNVKYVPLGYHPTMKRFDRKPAAARDIDVIFFGSRHPRRTRIFEALRARNLRVVHGIVAHGAERDRYLARSKLALNLQYYERGVYPTPRAMHLVANGVPMISEEAPEMPEWAKLQPHVPYAKIVDAILAFFKDGEQADTKGSFEAFEASPLVLPQRDCDEVPHHPRLSVSVPATLKATPSSPSPEIPKPLVLSANFRAFDRAKPMPENGIRYDEKLHDNGHLTGHYLGKIPKCAPHLLGHTDDDILWIDGSMRPTGKSLDSLFALVAPGGVGCFRHRQRDCIYQEYHASLRMKRSHGEPLRKQVDHYRKEGHPEHWGLWECGLIVWRGAQKKLGEAWLAQLLTWSSQDQLSFPYLLRREGVTVSDLHPGTVVQNPWFVYEPHLK
jgi:hypothetical protein